MPAKVEACKSSLLAKWRKNPKEAPKRFKSGDTWKPVKDEGDLESAAFAICHASVKAQEEYMGVVMQEWDELTRAILEDGHGPLLRGVGAVNRPYLKFMRPFEIVTRDGREFIKAQIVRFGIFAHPRGPDGKLPFTREFWSKVIDNFKNNVYGQKVFLDKAHEPNAGSLGEVLELEMAGDGVDAIIDPTDRGREAIATRDVNYASIDLDFNYEGNQIAIAASEWPELEEVDIAEEIFTHFAIRLEEETMSGNPEEGTQDTPDTLELPEELVQLKVELTEMKAKLDAQQTKLDEDRLTFQEERARNREEIRREKVKVFLTEMAQPVDGKGLVTPVQQIIGAALMGDPIEQEGDATVELAEDASISGVHAYYRGALEALAQAMPRTVPTGSKVESQDTRPENVNLNAERAKMRDAMIMAKQNDGIQLTEDVMAEIKAALDRRFGEEG